MRFRHFASAASVCLIVLGFAGPAAAQSCLIGILCPPKTSPPPPPALPAPPPAPAVPPTEPITQPVTDNVDSVQQTLKTSVSVLEGQMLNLINADRAKAGLQALQVSGWAQAFARSFSEKMMAAGAIWHNPEYFAKGRAAMGANLLSENVGYDSSIPANHIGFMGSPSHRANILDGRLTHVGIGVAVSPSGRIYVTEDFARIPGSGAAGTISGASGRPKGAEAGAPPVALTLAQDDSGGDHAGNVETISLSAPAAKSDGPQGQMGSAAAEALAPRSPQSPAPMVPGLVAGGMLAVLAPMIVLGKKLLLLLGL